MGSLASGQIQPELKKKLGAVLNQYQRGDRSELVSILQGVQASFGYLPKESVTQIASFLGITESTIYSIATFYNQFRFEPLGRHHIKVCLGTACHLAGGELVLEELERELDIEVGATTKDGEFSLERVACIGCCAIAPVMSINEAVHSQMTPFKTEETLTNLRQTAEVSQAPA